MHVSAGSCWTGTNVLVPMYHSPTVPLPPTAVPAAVRVVATRRRRRGAGRLPLAAGRQAAGLAVHIHRSPTAIILSPSSSRLLALCGGCVLRALT